jgi:hypothetical protein
VEVSVTRVTEETVRLLLATGLFDWKVEEELDLLEKYFKCFSYWIVSFHDSLPALKERQDSVCH